MASVRLDLPSSGLLTPDSRALPTGVVSTLCEIELCESPEQLRAYSSHLLGFDLLLAHSTQSVEAAFEAWRRLMASQAPSEREEPLRAAVTYLVRAHIAANARMAEDAARRVGWAYHRTLSEIAFRLGVLLYRIGRGWIAVPALRASAVAMLADAALLCGEVRSELHRNRRDDGLPDRVKSTVKGTQAGALLVVARGLAPKRALPVLRAGLDGMRVSYNLGNRGVEAAGIYLELLARCYRVDDDQGLVDEAQDLEESLSEMSPSVAYSAGVLRLTWGIRRWEAGSTAEAANALTGAIRAFSEGMELSLGTTSPRGRQVTNALRVQRGYARHRLFMLLSSTGREAEADPELDAAIDDLEVADLRDGELLGFQSPLPSCLYWRAARLAKADQHREAIVDLDRALGGMANVEGVPGLGGLADRIRSSRARCRVRIALIEGNAEAVEAGLEELIELAQSTDVSIAEFLPAVDHLHDRVEEAQLHALVVRLVAIVERDAIGRSASPKAQVFSHSHAASLLLRIGTTDARQHAVSLHRAAIAAAGDTATPELLGVAGNNALVLAKLRAKDGASQQETEELLQLACLWIEASASAAPRSVGAFDQKTSLSKLGEAYLRLHSLTRKSEHGRAGIACFEDAIKLGNEDPNLLSQLAGAQMRLGRDIHDNALVRRGLVSKRATRELMAADQLRENFSTCAAAAFQLWRSEGRSADLRDAIMDACAAAAADDSWAWPLFQLAELAETPTAVRGTIRADDQLGEARDRLFRLVIGGDSASLRRVGATRAVQSPEFRRRAIGGRGEEPVYVIDDPHHLLNQSIVMKPGRAAELDAEVRFTLDFQAFLAERQAPEWMTLPEPIEVVRGSGDASIYVMRRAVGRLLADCIDASGRLDNLRRAIEFLAWFHAWGGSASPVATVRTDATMLLSNGIVKWWHRAGISRDQVSVTSAFVEATILSDDDWVCGKDPHAENWMVSGGGRMVMVDLEDRGHRPRLLEVAQLLYDYPLLETASADPESLRAGLLRLYTSTLASLGGTAVLNPARLQRYLLVRIAFGIPYVLCRAARGWTSTTRRQEIASLQLGTFASALRSQSWEKDCRQAAGELLAVGERIASSRGFSVRRGDA